MGVHVTAFAERAGLTGEQVTATRHGNRDSACWTAEDGELIAAVDALCERGRLPPPALAGFRRRFSLAQQLEILALCGNYHTVSFVANSADLDLESFGARFP